MVVYRATTCFERSFSLRISVMLRTVEDHSGRWCDVIPASYYCQLCVCVCACVRACVRVCDAYVHVCLYVRSVYSLKSKTWDSYTGSFFFVYPFVPIASHNVDTVARHCCTSLLHVTVARHCCTSLLHVTVARHCCTSLLHVTVARHCCTTLLHVTVVRHIPLSSATAVSRSSVSRSTTFPSLKAVLPEIVFRL